MHRMLVAGQAIDIARKGARVGRGSEGSQVRPQQGEHDVQLRAALGCLRPSTLAHGCDGVIKTATLTPGPSLSQGGGVPCGRPVGCLAAGGCPNVQQSEPPSYFWRLFISLGFRRVPAS